MKSEFIGVFILCQFVLLVTSQSDDISIKSVNISSLDQNLNITESSVIKELLNSDIIRYRRFIPFARPNERTDNLTVCTDSSEEFPDLLTEEQSRHGGFILYILIGIYCFTFLAIVCDKYFLPSVEIICHELNLSKDVAAATFMATATSCPELFTNIISTFITKSDLGIGTIVGSSLFNCLGVAALGGLAASKPIKINGWPLTRDVLIYILAVSLLVSITWDNKIYWYEGLTLSGVYFMYVIVLFNNNRITQFFQNRVSKDKDQEDQPKEVYRNKNLEANVGKEDFKIAVISNAYEQEMKNNNEIDVEKNMKKAEESEESEKQGNGLFNLPEGSLLSKIYFYYAWPLKFILNYTVPDPERYPKWYPVTFFMCIVWIGLNSYLVSWMMTLVGTIFRIPDAVLGLTFLAAGGCLPESISIVIMSRRGEGSMGVSNSMGANTMNILSSLGFPWFLKTIVMGANTQSYIEIESGSIQYTILALVAVAIVLYFTMYINHFHLSRTCGTILMIVYVICAVLAILSEMVFFPSNSDCR